MEYLGHIYTQRLFTVYLKLKLNWVSSILFGNSSLLRTVNLSQRFRSSGYVKKDALDEL